MTARGSEQTHAPSLVEELDPTRPESLTQADGAPPPPGGDRDRARPAARAVAFDLQMLGPHADPRCAEGFGMRSPQEIHAR